MIVMSHRGYWLSHSEKNSRTAFERSFALGFGTETDLRDRGSEVVISHDMAGDQAMPARDFFDIYKAAAQDLPLALNVKADGLQDAVLALLRSHEIRNYFLFDMAVPDGVQYARRGMRIYTRHSEHEPVPAYYPLAEGVWMDEFNAHWITQDSIAQHLQSDKAVCLVSPELHGRDHLPEWSHYRAIAHALQSTRISICTDRPQEARAFFAQT